MTIEDLAIEHPDAIIMDGFDDAIIGIDTDERVIYDYDLMCKALMNRDGMDYEEATEFIDYNSIRALPYMGDKAPIIMYPFEH